MVSEYIASRPEKHPQSKSFFRVYPFLAVKQYYAPRNTSTAIFGHYSTESGRIGDAAGSRRSSPGGSKRSSQAEGVASPRGVEGSARGRVPDRVEEPCLTLYGLQ